MKTNIQKHSWAATLGATIQNSEHEVISVAQKVLRQKTIQYDYKKQAKELVEKIHSESNGRSRIIDDLNAQKLSYYSIIRKELFFELMRIIDTHKELYYFSSYDNQGMVYADTRSLHQSGILDSMKNDNYYHDLSLEKARADAQKVLHQAKELLWPNRTDQFAVSGIKRKIPIRILDAPDRVLQKIEKYQKLGYKFS